MEVTVTFKVNSNQALLLLTLHDIITRVDPDDSIAATDYISWLVDEIAYMLPTYYDEEEASYVPRYTKALLDAKRTAA